MNEEVLRLDIPVNDVLAMAVLYSLEQLVDILADKVFFDSIGILLEDLKQVLFEVLEH